VQEAEGFKKHQDKPQVSGLLMFGSYILAGLIPLLPVVFLDYPQSVYVSVCLALISLFLLGFIKGKVLSTNPLRGGVKILVVGGIATLLGATIGLLFRV
jgi:vacuolar iron transporter family protein